MTFGAVMLFDVVATLRGGALTTLVLGATILRAVRGGVVGGSVQVVIMLLPLAPAKMADKS